jgi:hypothetical protein
LLVTNVRQELIFDPRNNIYKRLGRAEGDADETELMGACRSAADTLAL